jgi:hypothetical protein
MNTDKYSFLKLIDKYLSGKASRSEQLLVDEYYDRMSREEEGISSLSSETEAALKESIRQNILQEIHQPDAVRQVQILHNSFFRVSAAILIAVVAVSLYFFFPEKRDENHPIHEVFVQDDIAPGSNRALLKLADGREINLDDANVGQIAEAPGVKIIKTADGQLIYEILDNAQLTDANSTLLNTISTPRSGQYHVILPDGTKVWLNSESSISYPSRFSKEERYVEITGEAYFEVASERKRPFFVKSTHQKIEVLGTHFNVNAYDDEESTSTTLLEGSVKVYTNNAETAVLQPNQQAVLNSSNKLAISNVQAEEAMAWKNGRFVFNNADIQSVMRIIARWYDVEIKYENGIPNKTVGGDISKFENISQLLEVLEATGGIHFKREGRRIIVM